MPRLFQAACRKRHRQKTRASVGQVIAPFAIAAVLAPVGVAVAGAAIPAFLQAVPAAAAPLRIGFYAFAAFAAASGAKALRARSAPVFFFAAFGAALAVAVAVGRSR